VDVDPARDQVGMSQNLGDAENPLLAVIAPRDHTRGPVV
jgi:hypothetical protein